MTKYVFMTADNVGTDIDCEVHPTLESAQESMKEWYDATKEEAGENSECEISDTAASVYECGTGNMYYGVIKEIEV